MIGASAIGIVVLAPVAYVVGRKRLWVPQGGSMPPEAPPESVAGPPGEEGASFAFTALAFGAVVAAALLALNALIDLRLSALIGVFLGDSVADLYAFTKARRWERENDRVLLSVGPDALGDERELYVAPPGTPR